MSAGTYLFRYVPFLHRKCKHISTRYLFVHDLLKQGKHLPSQNLLSLNIRTPQVLHEIAPCQIPIQTPGSDTAKSNAARKITKKNPHATRLTNTPLNQCLLKATGSMLSNPSRDQATPPCENGSSLESFELASAQAKHQQQQCRRKQKVNCRYMPCSFLYFKQLPFYLVSSQGVFAKPNQYDYCLLALNLYSLHDKCRWQITHHTRRRAPNNVRPPHIHNRAEAHLANRKRLQEQGLIVRTSSEL